MQPALSVVGSLRQRSSQLLPLLSSKRFFSGQAQNDQSLLGKALSMHEDEQTPSSPMQNIRKVERAVGGMWNPLGLKPHMAQSLATFDFQRRNYSSPVPATKQEAQPPAPISTKVDVVSFPDQCLTPAQAYDTIVNTGAYKVNSPVWKTLFMGCIAGFYVSFGGLFACQVGGQIPAIAAANPGVAKLMFAGVFPLGLLLCALCGSELFTGNTAYMTAGLYEGKVKVKDLLKNWSLSYTGNFIGSLFMVGLVTASGVMAYNALPVTVATYKCSLGLMEAFSRGIICNWMVCAAVWLAFCSRSVAGKILAMWPPIVGFILMGGEHCVANMFFVPMAMSLGADISWEQFVMNNLVPVTAGNILGGALFMASTYSVVYGSLGKKIQKSIDEATKNKDL